MAKEPEELTDEKIAGRFIRFGRNYTYAGVLEVACVAARLAEQSKESLAAIESADYFEEADRLTRAAAWQAAKAAGQWELLAATVKRFEFMSGSFGTGEDLDPTGERSRNVVRILLEHAAGMNRKQDEPVDDEDE